MHMLHMLKFMFLKEIKSIFHVNVTMYACVFLGINQNQHILSHSVPSIQTLLMGNER